MKKRSLSFIIILFTFIFLIIFLLFNSLILDHFLFFTKSWDEIKIKDFYEKSNGIMMHRVNNYLYESDGIDYIDYINTSSLEYSLGRKWKIYQLEQEKAKRYLLPLEESATRIIKSYQTQLSINDTCNSICCPGSMTFSYNYTVYPNTKLKGNNHYLKTWYIPSGGRKPKSIVDSLDLLIDLSELKGRRNAHIIMLGDSLSQLYYLYIICSIQRTLGARIVSYKHKRLDNLRLAKGSLNEAAFVIFSELYIEINSTRIIPNRIRKIKISLLKYFSEYKNKMAKKLIPITINLACGLKFSSSYYDENKILTSSTFQYKGELPIAIILGSGTHFNLAHDYAKTYNLSMETYKQCEENGVEVIFRERPSQHFFDQYGGVYNDGTKASEIPNNIQNKRKYSSLTSTSCRSILVKKSIQLNSFYQALMKIDYFRDNINIITGNEEEICNMEKDKYKIDYLSSCSHLSYYWRSHINADCTHYLYSPGIMLPYSDWLYTIIYKWTLPINQCNKIPDATFLQGPEGLEVGIRDNHSKDFLPIVPFNIVPEDIDLRQTFLEPILKKK